MTEFSKINTDKTRMQIISSIVQRALRERGQLVPTVTDVSNLAQPGLESILFPRRVGSFTVENLLETVGSEATQQTYQYDYDKLDLNYHAIVSWFIKKRADHQSVVNIEADAIAEAAAEHAIDIDRRIISTMLAGAAAANDVTITGVVTRTKVLEIKEKLQKSTKLRANQAPFFLLVNSKREAEMLDIPSFVEADKYGSNVPLLSGELGRIFGFRVLVTDEAVLGDNQALAWIPMGFVYGNQMNPDFRELYIPKRAGTEYALDQLYGLKVLNGGAYISKITFN